MNKIGSLLYSTATCLYLALLSAPTAAAQKVLVTAYKIDPTTHTESWSIKTTTDVSAQKKATSSIFLSSELSFLTEAQIFIATEKPTSIVVQKKPSLTPIISIIKPEELQATGENAVVVINNDGTALLTTQKNYKALTQGPVIALPFIQEEPQID